MTPDQSEAVERVRLAAQYHEMEDALGRNASVCKADLRAVLALLSEQQVGEPNRDAMANRTEAEWEAIEEATMQVYSLREGHVLSADDIAALNLVDRTHRDDEEGATEAYHRGREEGLREHGGDELVDLEKRVSEALIARATEKAMRAFAERRADEAEFLLAIALAAKPEQQVREPVGAPDRAFVRHLIREMRAAIAANPEAPTVTTGPLDPDILERVLNIALTVPPEQQVESGRLRKALAAIETVLEASFIEWAEKIAPSKRGAEDDDEARKESKAAVWAILDEAARDLREALSPSPAQAEGDDR